MRDSPAGAGGASTTTTTSPGLPSDNGYCQVQNDSVVDLLGVDAAGNVHAVRALTLNPVEPPIALLTKYGPQGQLLWQQDIPYAPTAMSVGADGSLVLAGPGSLTRLSPSGATIYDKHGYSGALLLAAVGAQGDVVVAGKDWVGGCGGATANGLVVAALSPEGECLWSQEWSASLYYPGLDLLAVERDPAGNTIIFGEFGGTIQIGNFTATSDKQAMNYITKLDPTGKPLYLRTLDVGANSRISVAKTGDLLLAGALFEHTDLGSGPIAAGGVKEGLFVGKLDPLGNYLWSRLIPGKANTSLATVRADGEGRVVLAGALTGTYDFGAAQAKEAGEGDVFIARYDTSGTLLDARGYGDDAVQGFHQMVLNEAGTPILTGFFQGAPDLGSGPLDGYPKGAESNDFPPGPLYSFFLCQVPFLE